MTRYPTIILDIPWKYRVWNHDTGVGRSAEAHYPTLDHAALKALPMHRLMARDCAVFMWATMPTLAEAFAVGQAWQLTYKTVAFVWAKSNKLAAERGDRHDDPAAFFTGMGHWTRANAELVLLFTRGNPRRLLKNVRQLVVAPVAEHSRKPDEVQHRIERLVPGPYLEVFARRQLAGWDAIGNEIDGRDIRDVLAALVDHEPQQRPLFPVTV